MGEGKRVLVADFWSLYTRRSEGADVGPSTSQPGHRRRWGWAALAAVHSVVRNHCHGPLIGGAPCHLKQPSLTVARGLGPNSRFKYFSIIPSRAVFVNYKI
jgi:hypothetical protein